METTNAALILDIEARRKLAACYRFILSLSGRRRKAADGEILAGEPSAASDPGAKAKAEG